MIKFKDYGVEEAVATANITLQQQPAPSEYSTELGVYHENEISGQNTLSPKPTRNSFKNKRKTTKNKRNSFLKEEIAEQKSAEQTQSANGDEQSGSESETEKVCSKIFPEFVCIVHCVQEHSTLDRSEQDWEANSDTPDVTIEIGESSNTVGATREAIKYSDREYLYREVVRMFTVWWRI